MSLLTLRIIPKPILLNQMEVPPMLINGKGCPVTGKIWTATAILIMAWNTKEKLHPTATRVAKALGDLLTIIVVL